MNGFGHRHLPHNIPISPAPFVWFCIIQCSHPKLTLSLYSIISISAALCCRCAVFLCMLAVSGCVELCVVVLCEGLFPPARGWQLYFFLPGESDRPFSAPNCCGLTPQQHASVLKKSGPLFVAGCWAFIYILSHTQGVEWAGSLLQEPLAALFMSRSCSLAAAAE